MSLFQGVQELFSGKLIFSANTALNGTVERKVTLRTSAAKPDMKLLLHPACQKISSCHEYLYEGLAGAFEREVTV